MGDQEQRESGRRRDAAGSEPKWLVPSIRNQSDNVQAFPRHPESGRGEEKIDEPRLRV